MSRTKIPGFPKTLPLVIIGSAHPSILKATDPNSSHADREDTWRLLDELWDMGLNMYDCAAIYGEEAIGQYLTERKRHNDAVILTKCAHPNAFRNRVTPFDMESDLHDSLAKLQTDHIDIYLLHRDDPTVPAGEIIEILNRFHKQGKIGVFGGSNWTVDRIREANRYAEEHGLIPFTISSPNYGLAHQVKDLWGWGSTTLTGPEHAKDRIWYEQNQMPVIAYSSMARGFFSGKFRSDEPDKAEQILDSFAKTGYLYPENMERLKRAEKLAEKYDCPVSSIALSFLYHSEMQVIPVLSGSKAKYFRQAIEAQDIPLTGEEVKWLDLQTDNIPM